MCSSLSPRLLGARGRPERARRHPRRLTQSVGRGRAPSARRQAGRLRLLALGRGPLRHGEAARAKLWQREARAPRRRVARRHLRAIPASTSTSAFCTPASPPSASAAAAAAAAADKQGGRLQHRAQGLGHSPPRRAQAALLPLLRRQLRSRARSRSRMRSRARAPAPPLLPLLVVVAVAHRARGEGREERLVRVGARAGARVRARARVGVSVRVRVRVRARVRARALAVERTEAEGARVEARAQHHHTRRPTVRSAQLPLHLCRTHGTLTLTLAQLSLSLYLPTYLPIPHTW